MKNIVTLDSNISCGSTGRGEFYDHADETWNTMQHCHNYPDLTAPLLRRNSIAGCPLSKLFMATDTGVWCQP